MDAAEIKDSIINPKQIIFQLQGNEDKIKLRDTICQLDGHIGSASEDEADMIHRQN